MAFPKTAVVAEDGSFIKVIRSAGEKEEFKDQKVTYVTKKDYVQPENPLQVEWDEFIGEAKPVKPAVEKKASSRPAAPALEGPYYMLKPLPPVADDHPKKPIWDAVVANEGGTCEQAKAACPTEAPLRKTSGKYTFNSEFRYFLKTHYVALGDKPEGYNYMDHKPVRKEKAQKQTEGQAEPAAATA